MFSCVSVCVFTYYFYVFIVKTGGGGGGGGVMDLVYGSSSSLDMNCEVNFVCCYADSPISGSFHPVLLRRCFVVGPRHTWMYPLRFILQQDEY